MNETLKEILKTSIYFLCVLIVALLIVTFVGQRTIVDGSSMEPTLSNNDNLIVDKLSYRFSDPKRFDVVVFPPRGGDGALYIKRIIGLPGETVYIDEEGTIYINDEILSESYGKETIHSTTRGRAADKVTLGEDEYFVMGDNRNDSLDSRYEAVGNVEKKDFIGRAWVRLYPFNEIGFVKNIRKQAED